MTGIVWAQPKPPTNEECQTCHAEPSMTRADGRPVLVEPAAFARSVHQFMGCVDCHADLATVTEFPHAERLKPVNCAACHDEPAMAFARSIHAAIPANRGGPATCADCHGPPHAMRPSAEADSATHPQRLVATCGRCHSESAPEARRGPPVAPLFADSIHGHALQRGGDVTAPTCSTCHTAHAIVSKKNEASPVFARNVPNTCGTCHSEAHAQYGESVHGTELQKGTAGAPHCASCHTAHQIASTQADTWQVGAVEQCGTCHREALATYRDTFHGKVNQLGFAPVAKCADCHQGHQVFRITDARSTVSPGRRLATCQTCHPRANANFALYEPHANKEDPDRIPALYHSARLMELLLLGTFGFFGLHTVLWFLRERTGPADPEEAAHG